MPLHNYGVLKGKVIGARREDDQSSPHYQIHVLAGDTHFRVPVNVKSKAAPSELLFLINESFAYHTLPRLVDLPCTYTPLVSEPGGLAVDFIRANLFDRLEMRPLPHNLPGEDNDLNDRIEHYVSRALQDENSFLYAFGQRWGPETHIQDKIFEYSPGNGVHDIHMNQGNIPAYQQDDGTWQDGALLFHFPALNQWVAIFLAFQSQAWHTDDVTGHRIIETPPIGPGNIPTKEEPDGIVRIVGALVNPIGPAPEQEKVILLNTSPEAIDLTGWAIADKMKDKCFLSGRIEPGGVMVAAISPPAELGNKGGIITLLDNQGLKVDGVAYTGEQARREGWVIAF